MPATDDFASNAPSMTAPGDDGFAITPHDTNELTKVTRSIWVGAAGTVVLVTKGGTTLTFNGCAAGSVIPVRAKIVKSTGTTATGLIGLV